MKAHLNCIKKSRMKLGLVLALMIIIISGCEKESNSNSSSIFCNLDDYSLYPEALEELLPSFNVKQSENEPYYILNDGEIVEAFDTQAVGAIETGIAKYWYPQYLATVIIAVDRDQTNAVVTGWKDLYTSQQEIGFLDTPGNIQMLTAAMSYGLEGENYSLTKVIHLLTSLSDKNRIKINTFEPSIVICYDYQAANLIESGRNIEIIVPTEGTYTYEKGLLSNEELEFKGNVDKLLLGSNLRLLDGQSKFSLYPDKIKYSSAARVRDYKHFAKLTQNVSSLIERYVFRSKLYMSIDNREHLYFGLIYIIIVTIWVASLLRRSMQKSVSYAAFITGIILNGWILVRLIKYQVDGIATLTRYLWYGFYIFQLTLPLVLLWMAWAIDKPEDQIIPPKWWKILAAIKGVLIVFVFTNDLHGFVFKLDLSRSDWAINYSYGFGYYIILFVCMINLLAVFVILIEKSIKNTRKIGFIFPLILFVLFIVYNYKYIMRDPFVYQTDLTIVMGVFTMLMFESCIWAGLIPVNTKYIDIFTRSPLKMQIINKNGEMAIASTSSIPLDKEVFHKLVDSSPMPVYQNNSLIYANPIPGGYAVWHEDVNKLYQLHKEVQESTEMLTEANAMLAEEEKLKRSINEEMAKEQLMEQLEAEIAESIKQLSTMIEELPKAENYSRDTTRIALLLCYIKRRCIMFFQEKETNIMDVDELIIYIDELSEMSENYNVQTATLNKIKENISIRYAILLYDFSYIIADLAVERNCSHIIQNLEIEGEYLIMRALTSGELGEFKIKSRFINAIEAVKGKIVIKDLEDTIGISISFPKGGDIYE